MKELKLTTTYEKIKRLNEFHRICQGGQGSGKNWAIAVLLLQEALEKKRIITIVTDTFENLKDGAIKDFSNIFSIHGLDFNDFYNKQDKNLYWGESEIQFRYVADHKNQAGKSKRRNILYLNEANKVGYNAAEPYIARTSDYVLYDFNPDYQFWVHKQIEPLENACKVITTYKDNEHIPDAEKAYIESRRHLTEWFKVYGEGKTGVFSERLIYSFSLIDELPEGIKRLPSGMDYGKSPDSTSLVNVYLDGVKLYIDERFTETGLLPYRIPEASEMSVVDKLTMIDFEKHWTICIGDDAADTIADMKAHGYTVQPIRRYAGSVKDGIIRLSSYELIVTKRSQNVINAMESWHRKIDRNGEITSEPEGHEPDPLAASRYVVMGKAIW